MALYTNHAHIPLSIAVWLATDHYDHDPDPNKISATSLMKPLRQLILAKRVPQEDFPTDLESLVASRMGTAIHDSIEKAWLHNRIQALQALGYPDKIIQKVKVNPEPGDLQPGDIPVYMEQRESRVIDGITVTGKYDFVGEGRLEDFKSTGVFSYMSGSNDEKYILQGSIYRWLSPHIITQDEMLIQFIFTDWQKIRAITEAAKGYPEKRTVFKRYPLKSLAETEHWIRNKLTQIRTHMDLPEEQLPLCTDEELWRKPPTFKYYKNPQKKMTRSTKNFDNIHEARIKLAEDGGVGIIVEAGGEVTACKYCPAFPICSQAQTLIEDGSLKL